MNDHPQADFKQLFRRFFGYELTEEQGDLLNGLHYFSSGNSNFKLLILTGYAGTGKTSMMATYVKTLGAFRIKTRLLAPTGRAAKVFAGKAGQEAFTIHKQIYRRKDSAEEMSPVALMPNLHTNTIFLVDEASMIPEFSVQRDGSVGRDLLNDLIEYIYSGKNCRLIFLGDEGQLPPVGASESPAINLDYLRVHYPKLELFSFKLTHVLRQSHGSGILTNATELRSTIHPAKFKFDLSFHDLVRLSGDLLQEELENCYSRFGPDQTIVITRSNKRANLYNQQIRGRILWFEEQLCQNDCLMVVRNNYYWLDDNSKAGFIANGEQLRVKRIRRIEQEYGFEFARVIVQMEDYPDEPELEVLLLLESLLTESPSLPRERMKELFHAIEKDHSDELNKRKRYEKVLKDPYFNALQVKYAYAITCHKSQGGQWAAVFIDPGYLSDEMVDQDYYRWLYTAVTRASEKVYLVNFPDDHFTA
jgi:exodeoxyribonuclease-5